MSLPIPIIGSLIDSVVNYFTLSKQKRLKLKALKQQAVIAAQERKDKLTEAKETAAIKRVQSQDQNIADYDRIAQENARTSIIDEIMIVWVLSIVTMIFVPSMQPYVIEGFKSLEEHVPIWFQLVFIGCFIAKLGLRFLFSTRRLFGKDV